MIALLPKHKGTEKLHADLKHRLAKLEEEGAHVARSGHHGPDPGRVKREGAGQWVMLGPPNAGKSALLAALTHAHPEVADYPFTTRAPQPGMVACEDVQVQLVDTPAVAPGHVESWLPGLAGGADGLLVVVDLTADGIGGVVSQVLEVMEHGHVWPSPPPLPARRLTAAGAAPRLPGRQQVRPGRGRRLRRAGRARRPGRTWPSWRSRRCAATGSPRSARRSGATCTASACTPRSRARSRTWASPSCCHEHATVHDLAVLVHREMADRLKFARVWGHAQFEGQQVDRHHELFDQDVIELHA